MMANSPLKNHLCRRQRSRKTLCVAQKPGYCRNATGQTARCELVDSRARLFHPMAQGMISAFLLLTAVGAATPVSQATAAEKPPLVREIFVPGADLDAILEGQPERMLLTRKEYEELLAKAKKAPERHAPQKALLTSADYQATIETGRARLVGHLEFEVLEEGLWAMPLDLAGLGIRRAGLDGKTASLARSGNEQLTLFLEGVGRHELALEMIAPMATSAARQRLTVRLPDAPTSRLHLAAPGDVEIKAGANVAERVVDEEAGVTRFELPVATGKLDLDLSLNSRLLRRDRVVIARSVLVDELTEAYERLHATVSMAVLHRAVERFDFALPEGFEITDVATPQLARWAVASRDGKRVLEVYLREPATDSAVLTLSAIRTDTDLAKWQLSRFVPLDVLAESAVVGVLLDQRLNAQTVTAEGLIPIDTSVLRKAIPETVFQAAPGAPSIRPITAWYAPHGEFKVAADFVKPPAEVAVMTNLLLVLEDQRQRVQGGFLLAPEAEPLFEFEVEVPALWHVTSVTDAEQKALSYERYGSASQPGRVRVRLPRGVDPGQQYRVYFEAEAVPPGWLGQWDRQTVEYPRFAVRGAARDVGAIAIEARDDMVAQPDPDNTQRLSILGKEDKGKYLADVVTDLAYRYESPDYRLPLVVRRTTARVTADTFSFLRIEPDALVAHYEVIYNVEEARTRRVSLVLPENTPETVTIRGLDGVHLKEYLSTVENGRRRWDVLLAEPRRGRVRLAVDFYQPQTMEDQEGQELPIVAADGVIWQSGHLAVEGDAELEVAVEVDPMVRRCDVGELVDADYQPGARLLGVFAYVAQPGPVKVDVIRREGLGLFAAIVHRARLVSRLSAAGVCQTEAEYQLVTKVALVEVSLPEKAELWSGSVNGKPIRPQKEGDRWLINLPATDEGQTVALQLVYELPVGLTDLRGEIDMAAPQLRFRGKGDALAQEIPVADFRWDLHPPDGCTVLDSHGTVLRPPERPELAIWTLAKGFGRALFGSPLLLSSRPLLLHQDNLYEMGPMAASDDAGYETLMEGEMAEAPALEATPSVDFEEFDAFRTDERLKREAAGTQAVAEPAAPPKPKIPASAAASGWGGEPEVVPQRRGFKSTRALQIDLQSGPNDEETPVTFTSLGTAPRLAVTLADGRGFRRLAWAVALAVALIGVLLTTATVRRKLAYVLAVIGVGSLLPLLHTILPFLPDTSVTLGPANAAVFAAGLLIPYYLAAGFIRWLAHTAWLVLTRRSSLAVASAILVVAACLPCVATAEPPVSKPYVVEIVDPLPPVTVPDDAVVIPYDPSKKSGVARADRILVPYAKYVELWNRAYPDAKKTQVPPPADYAPAGVTYQTTLVDEGDLLLRGQMDLNVFVEQRIEVPLGLAGGVFTEAELDGKPARLSVPVAQGRPVPVPQAQQAAPNQQAEQQRLSKPIVLLHVEGKGRHVLTFTVRMRLERRGGWRTVQSRVPVAPAASLEIRVPQAETELLLQNVADRNNLKTEKADERLETALGPEGILNLQWRPSVAEGVVDHSLTAESNALLDVQEDGVRLAWSLALDFRRSQHEQFSVRVPSEYVVERVEGTNVRGWEIEKQNGNSKVTVTLLKAAEGREQLTFHLWRGQAVSGDAAVSFTSPTVRVDGAALHKGQITIRRSPMLDLRVESVAGATRTDVPQDGGGKELATEESPWGIRPFQTYRFGSTDYKIHLAVKAVEAKLSASLQSVFRISEYERSLECRALYQAANRKMYRAAFLLPESFQLEAISAPGQFEWSITDHEGRPKLSVLLSSGQEGNVTIVFEGQVPREAAGQDVTIPNVQILGVPFKAGQLAVQVDPAYDVAARDLMGCHTTLLDRIAGWVSKEQRHLTAVALVEDRPDYSGVLRLTQRQPDVRCETITNVRVTDRALKETVYLDYRIEHAGVREVSFVLPSWMANARFHVPMLRQKTIRPEREGDDSPLRVRLELQEEMMGDLRVLVENDRTLQTGIDLQAPIPIVVKGDRYGVFSVRQFVALEKAGLDDIQWEEKASSGVEPLKRRQQQWARLASILSEGIAEAFLVDDTEQSPQLVFRARRFEARRTTDARIGMAETQFVLDGAGTYRAEQLYWIDNKTEQYLEIVMPQGADLWTAQLWTFGAWTARENGQPAAGEPIKPTKAPDSVGPGHVRIPLIKTAEGDSSYVIRLQYGGTIGMLGTYKRFDLPFIRPVGIKIDQSQVRLYVPKTHWFDFDDTMTLVEDEMDLRAGKVAYVTKETEKLTAVLREGNPFAKARAMNSVSVLNSSLGDFGRYEANERFEEEKRQNLAVAQEAEKAAEKVQQSLQQSSEYDNRDRLRQQVEAQSNSFARNVVQGLGSNFKADRAAARKSEESRGPQSDSFNALWLDQSQLANPQMELSEEKAGKALGKAAVSKAKERVSGRRQRGLGLEGADKDAAGPGISQKKASSIAESKPASGPVAASRTPSPATEGELKKEAVARYQARHMQQQTMGNRGYAQEHAGRSTAEGEGGGGMGGGHSYGYGAHPTTPRLRAAEQLPSDAPVALEEGGQTAVDLTVALPAGLASLDVDFPVEGRQYCFMTPQGDVSITGRAVATETVFGLGQVLAVLVLIAILAYVLLLASRGRFRWWLGRTGSTCLIAIGLLTLLCLPVIGILATVGGLMAKVNRRLVKA